MQVNALDDDPVVVLINPDEEVPSLDEWLAHVAEAEPVDLGMSAAALLAEARDAGEA